MKAWQKILIACAIDIIFVVIITISMGELSRIISPFAGIILGVYMANVIKENK